VNAVGSLVAVGAAGVLYAGGDSETAALVGLCGAVLLVGVVWPRLGVASAALDLLVLS